MAELPGAVEMAFYSAWTEEGEIRCPDYRFLCGLLSDGLQRRGLQRALVVISGPTRRTTGCCLWRRGRLVTLWYGRHLPQWARRATRVAARQWVEREWRRRGPAGRLRLLVRFFR